MGHITRSEAEARLRSRFDLELELLDVHVEMAEESLKSLRPFVGYRYDSGQATEFPRTVLYDGDVEGEIPGAVLDYLALRAAYIANYDEITPVSSYSKGVDTLRKGESYARPKLSRLEAYLRSAGAGLGKYQRSAGTFYRGV